MVKETKGQKGITLVALVITVIVLLILAGVAMSMISGQDGLFAKANSAQSKTNEQSQREALQVAWALAFADMYDDNGVLRTGEAYVEDIDSNTSDSVHDYVMAASLFQKKIGDTATDFSDGVGVQKDNTTFTVVFGSALNGSNAKIYTVNRKTGAINTTTTAPTAVLAAPTTN